DSRVKAIVLVIDSPGGEVTASDAIYSAVVKAGARKPVVVYMESLAASGGYYVSCGGKFLMASETTITGSIGVIIQTLNYEQLFNKVGLASVIFKSGKFKDMLNGARPITPEERELVQNFIMKTYDKFLGIVAKERNLSADLLRNTIADGRILSGKEAFENKLIDGLFAAFGAAPSLGSNVLFALYFLASIYIYISLIRQISARTSATAADTKRFGLPEAIVAAALIFFLLLNISASVSGPSAQLSTRNLLANLLLTVLVVLSIVTFLQLRGFDLGSLGGFFKIGFVRALGTGIILLFFDYTLIFVREAIAQWLYRSGSRQLYIYE